MKLVLHTQFRENYGAHDWDGEGECPQYWKMKGGNTYICEMDLEQAQSEEFYNLIEGCVTHKSEYAEEYVVGETVVDQCDFKIEDFCESWESPVYMELIEGNRFSCVQSTKIDYSSTCKGRISTYVQVEGEQTDMCTVIEKMDGTVLPYSEFVAELEAAKAA